MLPASFFRQELRAERGQVSPQRVIDLGAVLAVGQSDRQVGAAGVDPRQRAELLDVEVVEVQRGPLMALRWIV